MLRTARLLDAARLVYDHAILRLGQAARPDTALSSSAPEAPPSALSALRTADCAATSTAAMGGTKFRSALCRFGAERARTAITAVVPNAATSRTSRILIAAWSRTLWNMNFALLLLLLPRCPRESDAHWNWRNTQARLIANLTINIGKKLDKRIDKRECLRETGKYAFPLVRKFIFLGYLAKAA